MYTQVIRKYYYTSEQGSDEKRLDTTDWLKTRGIEAPAVFERAGAGREGPK